MPKSNKSRKKLYMDFASSGTPNPSAIHGPGVLARKKIELVRQDVGRAIGARQKEVIFTSCGTESNNLAILGLFQGKISELFEQKPHIVITNIEHTSVLDTCKYLEKSGICELSIVEVEKNGIVDPRKIKEALRSNTVLASVMYANNEIGTVQPLSEIAKIIRHYNKHHNAKVLFHTDAVQAINFLDLNIERLGVDMMSLSGAKMFDGVHVGVLYKKHNVILCPIMHGGEQEFGLRPGTENVENIFKFGQNFNKTRKDFTKKNLAQTKIRDYFIKKLQNSSVFRKFKIKINGDLINRLPNNINITIPNIPSDLLVLELDARGVYTSSKSACKSGDGKASHVLQAIDPEIKETDGFVRFSFGDKTKKEDIDFVIKSLESILKKLEKWYTK